MTRTMFDAVTPGNIPRTGSTLIAGYADGAYANLSALRARFPNEQVIPIAVFASYPAAKGYVLDCENGDATNAEAVRWCQDYPGSNTDLTIYTNSDNLPSLLVALSVLSTRPNIWVAQYDGVAVIPSHAGWNVVAKQYATGTYDKSVVVNAPAWLGVDTKAAPVAVTPSKTPADWVRVLTFLVAVPEKVYEGYNASDGWDNNTPWGIQFGENLESWCVMFIWDIFSDAFPGGTWFPKTDNVNSFTATAKADGQWSEYPSVGAWVNFENGGHTECVTGFDATYVYTKGGNTIATGAADNGQGNGVFSHKTLRTATAVVGYYAPKFPDGVCPPTADPNDYRGGKAVTSYRFTAPAAPVETQPKNTKIGDDEMVRIVTYPKGSGWKGDFTFDGTTLHHIKSEAAEAALKALGVQTSELTTAAFNALYAEYPHS